MDPSLVIFLHSHRYDRLYQAASLLLAASAMGWRCHLFLFHGALASYVAGTWDERNITGPPSGGTGAPGQAPGESAAATAATAPESAALGRVAWPEWAQRLQDGFDAGNFRSLYWMVEKAAGESGGLKILACSTSCRLLELDLAGVRKKVDEVVGLPTMMKIAESARHALYI
ncbi:MAG: hypothetical protein ACE5EO_11665 [Candidatus Krumholzibacteriia bacterium]